MERLTSVGSYARELGASIERLYENALDWEHLPHAHGASFGAIELVEERPSGWSAVTALPDGRPLTLDLELDRAAGRWVTDSFADNRLVGRIETIARAMGPASCRVEVEFLLPEPDPERREAIGAFYEALYARLYDEDEALMIARAAAIARGPAALAERREARLPTGARVTVPRYCPHQGLPLDAEPERDGTITCPWHGYRFDIATGRCVSGAQCGWVTANEDEFRRVPGLRVENWLA